MSDGKADGSNATGITFGRWLKQTRQQRGIGPRQFAELIGCSTITLLKIEAGERRPSRQIAELMAEQLNIPADEMEAFVALRAARGRLAGGKRARLRLMPPGAQRTVCLPISLPL